MRVAVVQFAPRFGRIQENRERALGLASGLSAEIVVLPELFATGYQFLDTEEALRHGEEIPGGPTQEALERFARSEGCWVAAGLPERDGERAFNSAVLVGPEGLVGSYRKTHLFDREKDWATPGDSGFRVWEIGGARVGLMICFDWRFPEAARTLALKGADLLIHPSNLVYPQCQEVMRARSVENNVYTATANRTGTEQRGEWPATTFTGLSQITGPRGELLGRLDETEDGVCVAGFDPALARDKGQGRNDFFADRRPEMYEL